MVCATTGCSFRGLILSEFGERPLEDFYYAANDFPGRVVADPFMGGGRRSSRPIA